MWLFLNELYMLPRSRPKFYMIIFYIVFLGSDTRNTPLVTALSPSYND